MRIMDMFSCMMAMLGIGAKKEVPKPKLDFPLKREERIEQEAKIYPAKKQKKSDRYRPKGSRKKAKR